MASPPPLPPHDDPAAAPDARRAVEALWQALSQDAAQAPPPTERDIRRLARAFGLHGDHCVVGLIAGDRSQLVRESAHVLTCLMRIWAARNLSAGAVWTELDRRTQVGELLMMLNNTPRRRAGRSAGRALGRPWKIQSTKLP
ncbi:phosphoribosyl-ATP pyrophosphatase [Gluconacetobacter sp. Hr-1-5]|uniref:phosphoribosyl-ATP pyrophosphatase n=1 Tax=Gluconacetobacter sp. Hr-1-5 TaxID=3395370 RepID=UPI003B5227C1